MATLFRENNGNYRVQFCRPDGKRMGVRLGRVTEDQAERQRAYVEDILQSRRNGHSPQAATTRWLSNIGDELAERLARAGLTEPRIPPAAISNEGPHLARFLDEVIAGRLDVKPNTLVNLKGARERLIAYFGVDKLLADVTPGDADDFVRFLRGKKYAPATIGRSVGISRQFFRVATRRKILTENPFADIKAPAVANSKRRRYVTRETIARVLDACPDAEWRLIVALSRYGGLRCPSEHLSLKLEDIDLAGGRMTVTSPKTEHHEGGGSRIVPIFPELRPFLEEVYEQAEPGRVFMIERYRRKTTNMRTHFLTIIKRAGVEPWPRVFNNLRASCQTDLASQYPVHWVCRWLGNSELIADKHYLSVPDEAYERAAAPVQKAVQHPVAPRRTAVPN
jgi:integrase